MKAMELFPIETTKTRTQDASRLSGAEALMNSLLEKGKLVYLDTSSAKDLKFGVRSGVHGLRRSKSPKQESIALLGPVPLPINVHEVSGLFSWYVFTRTACRTSRLPNPTTSTNTILVYNDILAEDTTPLVRLHSACHTGDILGSMRCDCGPQLHESLRRIVENGSGALIYISNHEGRGIGLWAKALSYILQDKGFDTYEANEILGFPHDARNYLDSLVVLRHLLGSNKNEIKLLSNNPEKKRELEQMNFLVAEMVPLVAGVNPSNIRYLKSKVKHGHLIYTEDLR